jgi:hypothetical protein
MLVRKFSVPHRQLLLLSDVSIVSPKNVFTDTVSLKRFTLIEQHAAVTWLALLHIEI